MTIILQCDRECAVRIMADRWNKEAQGAVLRGFNDHWVPVQECAHHRHQAEIRERERRSEGYEELLGWCAAYPLKAFPEPDLERAAQVLKNAGMTLDAISASNFRHVLKRVEEIARASLRDQSNDR